MRGPSRLNAIGRSLLPKRELLDELDVLLRRALRKFIDDVHARRWRGRELESVSLFAHRLAAKAKEGGTLYDSTQVVVGALVPGVEGINRKRDRNGNLRVNKDLSVWPTRWGTALGNDWMVSKEPPLAVLEWKVLHPRDTKQRRTEKLREHQKDIEWITEFSGQYAPVLAFAVLFEIKESASPRPMRMDSLNVVTTRRGEVTAPIVYERRS